jgi:hypothetical protein
MAKKKTKDAVDLVMPGRSQIQSEIVAGHVFDAGKLLINIFSNLLGGLAAGQALTQKVLKRVGSRPTSVLGVGAMGVAFSLDSGRVLKLTRDRDEVEAAQALRDRHHPNVTRFYDTFIARNGVGIGIVVRGAVDQNVARLGKTMPEFFDLGRILNRATGMATAVQPQDSMGRWKITRKSLQKGMEVYLEALRPPYIAPVMARSAQVLADTIEGVGFIKKCGVYGFDFHAGNIGVVMDEVGSMRGVVYDIGITSSRARKGVDVERVGIEDILPVFGQMVAAARKNPLPTVRV